MRGFCICRRPNRASLGRTVLAADMTATSSARLRGLCFVKVLHGGSGLVYELVCSPFFALCILAEFCADKVRAMLRTGIDIHIALIALIYPFDVGCGAAAYRTGELSESCIVESCGLAFKAFETFVQDRLFAAFIHRGLVVWHARCKYPAGLGIEAQSLSHVELCADKGGIVRIAESVMRHAGLLDLEMLHRAGEGFLVLVAAGLEVVDKLKVDPACDPVPVKIVDYDVLLEDALIVAAPGEKRPRRSCAAVQARRQRRCRAQGAPCQSR